MNPCSPDTCNNPLAFSSHPSMIRACSSLIEMPHSCAAWMTFFCSFNGNDLFLNLCDEFCFCKLFLCLIFAMSHIFVLFLCHPNWTIISWFEYKILGVTRLKCAKKWTEVTPFLFDCRRMHFCLLSTKIL